MVIKKKFKILPHRADLKIVAFGNTKEELFKNCMIGMFSLAHYEPEKNSHKVVRSIKIQSFDTQSLLVDFLNELLYLAETKKEVYTDIDFKKFTENKIVATVKGKRLKRMGIHIKGVTHHGLSITQRGRKWKVVVLCDI